MNTLVGAGDAVVRRIELRAMGVGVAISLWERTAGIALLEDVARWFGGWQRSLSRSSPHSELSRLNARDGAPTKVSASLWSAIHLALDAAAWTDGLVAPAAEWRAVEVDDRAARITVPRGVRLDLDAIATCWAVDRAAARLSGCGAVWFDVGGDVTIRGPRPDGSPWSIAVTDPARPREPIAIVRVAEGAVATAEARGLVDPRTEAAVASDVRCATVLASSAAEAKVAARGVVLCGARQGLAWIDSEPTLAAIVVRDDGRVLESKRAAALLAA